MLLLADRITQKEESMATTPSPAVAAAREKVRTVAPKLIDLTEKVLFGDVWERPGLSKRDRSLITVAALMSTYRPEQLRVHIARALENGVTKEELGELITHLAFYSGWPTAMTAATVAKGVFDEQS
jgi:4-carboxymuconolactone decarboxylase